VSPAWLHLQIRQGHRGGGSLAMLIGFLGFHKSLVFRSFEVLGGGAAGLTAGGDEGSIGGA